MNARNKAEVAAIETPFDDPVPAREPVKATAIVPMVQDKTRLEVTEILDAAPQDEKQVVINGIVPLQYTLSSDLFAAMLAKYSGVTFDVSTPDGRKEAKEAAAELSRASKAMETEYSDWNSPIMAMTKHARTQKQKAQDVLDTIKKPIEEALNAVREAEKKAEAERAARETARVADLTRALAELETLPNRFVSASVTEIEAAIADVSALNYLDYRKWDEQADKARALQVAAVDALKTHLTNAQAREQLEQVRREQAEADARRAADAALTERITAITTAPMSVFNKPAEDILRLLNRLKKTDPAEFGERATEAQAALTSAQSMVEMMLTQAQATEAAAAQAKADADALAALQAAEAKRIADAKQAEQDAIDAAARAEQDAKDAAAEAAARAQREQEEAARAAEQTKARALSARRARLEDHASELLALLIEARAYVTNDDLTARINALHSTIEGE